MFYEQLDTYLLPYLLTKAKYPYKISTANP